MLQFHGRIDLSFNAVISARQGGRGLRALVGLASPYLFFGIRDQDWNPSQGRGIKKLADFLYFLSDRRFLFLPSAPWSVFHDVIAAVDISLSSVVNRSWSLLLRNQCRTLTPAKRLCFVSDYTAKIARFRRTAKFFLNKMYTGFMHYPAFILPHYNHKKARTTILILQF